MGNGELQGDGSLRLSEVFWSIQGEGLNAGRPCAFVRFAGCNMACTKTIQGFDCDTDHRPKIRAAPEYLLALLQSIRPAGSHGRLWCVLTGGEPMLQVDHALVQALHKDGWIVAVETNGTLPVPGNVDWICLAPKRGGPVVVQKTANEVKHVLSAGQEPVACPMASDNVLLSPAFTRRGVDKEALQWCIQLVKRDPRWRLSVQQHKAWGIR